MHALCTSTSPPEGDVDAEKPGYEKDWSELTELESASVLALGWTEETWQGGDLDPYRRPYVGLDENEQAAAFMLGIDERWFYVPQS